jgi:glutathione reductase (NADPH)
MSRQYDVVVLGSGVAGGTIARRCKENGLSAAVVESGQPGGVCPLRGCEPKKVLADAAKAVTSLRRHHGIGVKGEAGLDWQELMRFKQTFVEPVPGAVAKSFEKRGVDLYLEPGVFTGPTTLRSGEVELEGRHVVIATGSEPRPLGIPGEEHIHSSTQFLELEKLPDQIIFMGGGYISFEFAYVAATAGAHAVILHRSQQPLKQFDPGLVDKVVAQYTEDGISLHVNAPVMSVERNHDMLTVYTGGENEAAFKAPVVVHGAGRVPSIAALDLPAAGVDASRHGVVVNEYMQSVSNPAVWAAGDVAEPDLQLTPVAVAHATAVAHNILHPDDMRPARARPTPNVLFSDPVLAGVGLLEEQAREQGLDYEVSQGDAAKWAECRRLGIRYAGYKILANPDTGHIYGAHYLGPHAEEVINIIALAMRHGVTTSELIDNVWSYPSFGYALRYMLG